MKNWMQHFLNIYIQLACGMMQFSGNKFVYLRVFVVVVVVDNAAAHSSAAKAPEAHGLKHLSGTLVAGLKNETTYLSKMLQGCRAAPAQSSSDPGFRQS